MTTSPPRPGRLAYAALVAVSFFWGTTYLGIAEARESLPTTVLVGVRFTIAGLCFLAMAALFERQWPTWRDLRRNALVGLALLGVANGVVSWAEKSVPSGVTSVILAITPFAFLVFARIAGEPIPRSAWLGLALGFAAMLILAWPRLGDSTLPEGFWWAATSLFICPIAWSGGSVYARSRPAATGKLTNAACQNLTAGLLVTAIAYSLGHFEGLQPTSGSLWAMAYLVVFGSLVGYLAYVYVLATLPAEKVSLIPYANTVVAVILGWYWRDEPLDIYIVSGTLLVLEAVAVVNRARSSVNEPKAVARDEAGNDELEPKAA